MEAKQEMANVRVNLKRDNADVDCVVSKCEAVLRNQLGKVNEVSSITEARTDMSTDQGAGSSFTPESC